MNDARPPNEAEPEAAARPLEREAHGYQWVDNYAWLRAENWQAALTDASLLDDDILDYLRAENRWCEHAMADTRQVQQTLLAELRGRIREQEDSLPQPHGPWQYQYRYHADTEYYQYVRQARGGGVDELLLDVNHEAGNGDYFDVGILEMCPAHRTLAWTADVQGAERYELRLRIAGSHQQLPDRIADVDSLAWLTPEIFAYVQLDENDRASCVRVHRLGTDSRSDPVVFQEADPRYSVSVYRSRSDRFLFVHTGTDDTDEIHVLDLHAWPDSRVALPQSSDWRVIEPRIDGVEYSVEHQESNFLILTNADAPDYRLVASPIDTPARRHWTDVLPAVPGTVLLDFDVYRNWILWVEQRDALPWVCWQGADGQKHTLEVSEAAWSVSIDAHADYDSQSMRVDYSSPATPETVYHVDLITGVRECIWRRDIPSGHEISDYVVERWNVRSHDGAEVPVTSLRHRHTAMDGSAACVLYAYGAYGSSVDAEFCSNTLSLVNRGFIAVTAHVRGGFERGRDWYELACREHKPNSFLDAIAVAEHLLDHGYSAPDRLLLEGASAGGLLVGAVLNLRPDLFAAAIADVPFVDAVNSLLDDSLPLTPGEWRQWGNPIEHASQFHVIRQYSPYENARGPEYPALLITTAVSDSRVTYWEPAKWAARLREQRRQHSGPMAPLLFKTRLDAGHFGASGRFAELVDVAFAQAFFLKMVDAHNFP